MLRCENCGQVSRTPAKHVEHLMACLDEEHVKWTLPPGSPPLDPKNAKEAMPSDPFAGNVADDEDCWSGFPDSPPQTPGFAEAVATEDNETPKEPWGALPHSSNDVEPEPDAPPESQELGKSQKSGKKSFYLCGVEACKNRSRGAESGRRCHKHGHKKNRTLCNVPGCEKYSQKRIAILDHHGPAGPRCILHNAPVKMCVVQDCVSFYVRE